jgi:uncharacterized membrane protein
VVSLRRPRFGARVRRVARRTARRLATTAAAVALVLVVRGLAGVWAAAVLVALAALVGLIAGWAAVEARVFDRPRRCPAPPVLVPGVIHPRPTTTTGSEHVAFARGLAAVSAAYLTHCEQEASKR